MAQRAERGGPIWVRHRRAVRTSVVVGAAVTLALPVALGLGPSDAAPRVVPQTGVELPAEAEGFSPYLPQVSCDPVGKPGVVAFRQLIFATYGRGRDSGIVRACGVGGGSEHKEGRAWDWGMRYGVRAERETVHQALDWLLADGAVNARRTGLMYVIWNRQIWSSYRQAEGWRPYRGVSPHTDHVHFSFGWAGAMQRTSWWTGSVAAVEYGPCARIRGMRALPYRDQITLVPCPPAARNEREAAQQARELAEAARRAAENSAAAQSDAGPGPGYEPGGGEAGYGPEGAARAEADYEAFLAQDAARLAARDAALWADGSAPRRSRFTPPRAP